MQLGFSRATVEYTYVHAYPDVAMSTPDDSKDRIMEHLCFSATK